MSEIKPQAGRPSIYRNKNAKNIHGMITKDGERLFEAARKFVAKMVDWPTKRVSDGDVIEFLARGFQAEVSKKACKMQMEKYLGRRD